MEGTVCMSLFHKGLDTICSFQTCASEAFEFLLNRGFFGCLDNSYVLVQLNN